MNRKKLFLLFAAVVLLLPPIFAYSQSLHLKHYSSKDGLASAFVFCIHQDSQGYILFGTEHGLSRFNGREFQNLLDEEHELKNDYIMNLFEDRKGNLWIGTRGGGLIRRNSEGIKTYTTNDGLPGNRISAIVEDQEGNLWIGTHSGLSFFDGKVFTNYFKKNGLVDELITDILIDKKGNLCIGTEKGLSCLINKSNSENNHFFSYTKDNGLISNEINRLMMDHKGNLWIGTKVGLSCYQSQKKLDAATFISYTVKDGLADNFVNAILEDRNQNIWIGTEGGVSLFSSGKFTNYHGFPHDKIFSIFEDREGNLWFGTRIGVSRLNSLKITNFSVNDGLPDNYIWAIIEERPDRYWIGTDKGLSCYSDGHFKTYTTSDGLINNSAFNLLKDHSGNIWIATNGGLSVYSPKSGVFTNYTVDDGLPVEIVLSLEEEKNGTIWIGTTEGLCRFYAGQILPHNLNINLDPSAIQAILQDSRGNLWFSDTKGLWKISGNKSTRFTVREGLIGNYVYSLFEDSRKRIWIGTNQGLSCFNNGEFTNYSTTDGLSDNDCLFLLEDDNRELWIGTLNGLNRFNFNDQSFKTYTARDGLIATEMSHSTCLKDSEGLLWFGTINGITRFNPRLDRKNTVPPPVYITRFSVMEENYPLSDNLQFKYDENYIKLGFVGLCFTSPEDVEFQYRLEGVDKKWLDTRDPHVSYHALTPGKYVFRVLAKNNDGVPSLKPAVIQFSILPPYWQTWWFRGIVLLFLLSIGVVILVAHNKRIKEKAANEAKNKQLVMAQRMKLMGVLAGGAVHDLKNLLSIIIGYSNIVHEYGDEVTDEEKEEAVEIIRSTADTAFHVVKQILAFTRQTYDETKAFNLSELLDEILAILKVTVPPTMNIQWKPPEDKVLLHINPVKFKQVVMNLCLNAIQAMGDKGELKISMAKNPDNPNLIIIEVSDTGPGIEPVHLDKIFDPLFTTKEEEKGSGLGLFVVKQIIEEFEGKIQVQSTLGKGTTFSIGLPVQRSLADKLN